MERISLRQANFTVTEGKGRKKWCGYKQCSIHFSCSVVSNSLQPHGLQHARLPCPSPTPGACPNWCPLNRWCHPAISFSVIPFSCLHSFPAGSFPMSQFFTSGGQSIGASASVLPMVNNVGGRQLTEVLSNDFLHLPSEMREGSGRRKNENLRSMKEVWSGYWRELETLGSTEGKGIEYPRYWQQSA